MNAVLALNVMTFTYCGDRVCRQSNMIKSLIVSGNEHIPFCDIYILIKFQCLLPLHVLPVSDSVSVSGPRLLIRMETEICAGADSKFRSKVGLDSSMMHKIKSTYEEQQSNRNVRVTLINRQNSKFLHQTALRELRENQNSNVGADL